MTGVQPPRAGHDFQANPADAPRASKPTVSSFGPQEITVLHSRPEPSSDPTNAMAPVFLRIRTVVRVTGLGRSTIYRLIANQRFPCPVRLGPRAVAWRRSEIERWSETRPTTTQ